MKDWDLTTLEVKASSPKVISTTDDARAILLKLDAGEVLKEHQVHERAWVTVASGNAIFTCGDEERTVSAGHLFEFDPRERHEVTAITETRLLLLLTPWPGRGHPGTMDPDRKAIASETAAAIMEEQRA